MLKYAVNMHSRSPSPGAGLVEDRLLEVWVPRGVHGAVAAPGLGAATGRAEREWNIIPGIKKIIPYSKSQHPEFKFLC